MKKVYAATVILFVCVGLVCVFQSVTIYGAETLTITQDHFEFRDEPRVAEETLLGTLRAGTPVEWTGNTDGNWFEVRAPNGQVGWVHQSGVSAPKSVSRPKATPAPKQTTSRSVAKTTTASSTLQKKVAELEQTNTQYKALLEEKDRRVGELTREIDELEQKLVETAQEINDTKQFQEMEQTELTELQSQYDKLKATLDEKDAELATLQEEHDVLQEKVQPTERILYGSIGLWLLSLLGGIGIFLYVRHKKHGSMAIESEFGYEHRNYVTDTQQISPDLKPSPPTPPSAMPAAPSAEAMPVMGTVAGEDVVIELSDVLPVPEQPIREDQESIEDVQDIDIVADIEEIQEVEEVVEELTEADVIEEIEDIEVIEDVKELEEPEILDNVEEIEEVEEIIEPEEIEELEEPELIEEAEEITDVEELIEELGDAESGDVELELIPDDLVEEDVSEEPFAAAAVSLHEELEELEEGLDVSDFDYDAFYDELTGDASQEEIPPQEASEIVEVAGEEFEMLAEQNTQIIEEDEEAYDAEEYIEEIIEEVEVIEELPLETTKTLAEDVAETAEILELQELECVEQPFDIVEDIEEIEELEEIEEFEEVEEIEEIEEIEELEEVEQEEEIFEVEEIEEFEPAEQTIPPSLLEPSPILIEPEYEPSLAHEQAPPTQQPEPKGPQYDIELVYIGKNKEKIVELLSKIKGLTRSPQELVDRVPSIIARRAKQDDAKNFQVVMQKLGAEVRLIKQ